MVDGGGDAATSAVQVRVRRDDAWLMTVVFSAARMLKRSVEAQALHFLVSTLVLGDSV